MALPTLPHTLSDMQDTLPASTSNPSGTAATCRFLADGDTANASTLNRPNYALGENTDYLAAKVQQFVTAGPADSGADYEGTSAVVDAVTDIISDGNPATLYVLNGSYEGPSGSAWGISQQGLTIIGEGAGSDVIFLIDEGFPVQLTGNDITIENVQFDVSGATSSTAIQFYCFRSTLRHVFVKDMHIDFATGGNNRVEDIAAFPHTNAVTCSGSDNSCVRNLRIYTPSSSATEALIDISSPSIGLTFDNIYYDGGVGIRGIQISADCRQLTFKNILMEVGDVEGLYLSGSLNSCSFENCTFKSGDGYALLIDNTIDTCSLANCVFQSDTQLVSAGTDASPLHLGISFYRCKFVNSAIDWYELPAMEVCGWQFPKSGEHSDRSPYFEDCYLYDIWSKSADTGGVAPGTLVVPTSTFAPFHFRGCTMKNMVISRDGISYVIFDNSWLHMYGCDAKGLKVLQDTATPSVHTFNSASTTYGLLLFGGGSKIENLEVGTVFGGTYEVPIIYTTSTSSYVFSTTQPQRTVLDGVHISSFTASSWVRGDTREALMLEMSTGSDVRGFTCGDDSDFGDMSAQSNGPALILISGLYCTLSNSLISVTHNSGTKGIPYVVIVSGPGCYLNNNRIVLDPTSSTFQDIIQVTSNGDGLVINDCFIRLDGDMVSGSHLIAGDSAEGIRIKGCQLVADDTVLNQVYIDLGASDAYAAINGNILQTTNGASVPTITAGDSVPTAFSDTNILVQRVLSVGA